jgi:hypothetical protein
LRRRNELVCLSGNFTDEGLQVIGQAPCAWLAKIDLFGRETTVEGLRHLTAVPSLIHVGLHGTRVTKEAIRDLRRDNPGLFYVARD